MLVHRAADIHQEQHFDLVVALGHHADVEHAGIGGGLVDGVVEVELGDAGDPVVSNELERTTIKRSARKNGEYHLNLGYAVPCKRGEFEVWLSPHAQHEDDPRPEHLRPIPTGDPDNVRIRGIRSDAEAVHSQYKRTLIADRAMSLGWRRGLIDYYAFALYSNALADQAHPVALTAAAGRRLTRRRRTS